MQPLRKMMRAGPWAIVSAASGVLLGVSALLTWFEIEGYPLTGMDDYPTRSGTRSSPGTWLLLAGAAIVLSAVAALVRPPTTVVLVAALGASVLGALAVTWGWWTIAAYIDFEGGGDWHQPGLWLASVAAAGAVVASVVEFAHRKRE